MMAELVCPKCQSAMSSLDRSGVTLERCNQCGGIFLDNGELERIEAAEAAGSSTPTGSAGGSGQPAPSGQQLLGELMTLAKQYRGGKGGRF